MGLEIDLMANYPKAKRNLEERAARKTEDDRAIARQFGKEFFDGDRRYGYGGFSYNPKFWRPVIPAFEAHFGLDGNSSVLDVGCAKGFMLHDLIETIPGITVAGVDISSYAISNALDSVRPFVRVANATHLPYPDKSFDVVMSINTIHNLDTEDLVAALKEIERVSRRGSFVTVDAYRTEDEKNRMMAWNLTAKTILHVDEWIALFEEAGFTGDYYWFIP
jgi:SAM-dependent methyltransferase